MKNINRKKIRKLILQEMASLHDGPRTPKTRNPFATSAADPSPFEYKLADVISRAWEEHTLAQPNQPSDPSTWYMEVDRAAAHLEEAIMDTGLLNDLFKLIGDLEDELHEGEFHPDDGIRSQIPR